MNPPLDALPMAEAVEQKVSTNMRAGPRTESACPSLYSRTRIRVHATPQEVRVGFRLGSVPAVALGLTGLLVGVLGAAGYALHGPNPVRDPVLVRTAALAVGGTLLVLLAWLSAIAWRRRTSCLTARPDMLRVTVGRRHWQTERAQIREIRLHLVPVGPPDAPDAELAPHLDAVRDDGRVWYLLEDAPRLRQEQVGRLLADMLDVPVRVVRVPAGSGRPPNHPPPRT